VFLPFPRCGLFVVLSNLLFGLSKLSYIACLLRTKITIVRNPLNIDIILSVGVVSATVLLDFRVLNMSLHLREDSTLFGLLVCAPSQGRSPSIVVPFVLEPVLVT
jgi:hypothetical protein